MAVTPAKRRTEIPVGRRLLADSLQQLSSMYDDRTCESLESLDRRVIFLFIKFTLNPRLVRKQIIHDR